MAAAPNILMVIVDDMGVHQLGCYGNRFFETPQLDQLARESVKFNCAYSASPVCSPARAALYTGLHPARLHLTNYIPGTEPLNPRLLTPVWRPYLPVDTVTIGDAFKAHGYATAHLGKWHLAPDYHYRSGRPMDPESQGFDTVVVTRKPLATADPEGDPHHIERLTSEAITFMSTPREQPFLCIVAHNALHRPELAPAALVAKHQAKPGVNECHRPVIAGMVEQVDRSAGRLLDALRSSGRERNTIVVFTSDHGAFGRSSARKPLRGAKADLYEAGIRVPLFIGWSGRITPGTRDAPVFGTDLFVTLLDLAGRPVPNDTDGVSLRELLCNPASIAPEREMLCWHFPHYHHLGIAPGGAIRVGRWKLIEWFERVIAGADDGPAYELYDLEGDPGETRNLAADNPGLCVELASRLRQWRKRVGAQEMSPNFHYNPTQHARTAPPPPGDPGNPYGE